MVLTVKEQRITGHTKLNQELSDSVTVFVDYQQPLTTSKYDILMDSELT